MRPIKLTMTAFGPFATRQVVDFTKFDQDVMFLINGATGAGKSSLLDAICFALYGDSTGGERQPSAMRCDYAAPELVTEVELEFSLNQQHYKIRRLPTQLKPKARGDGVTELKAEGQLWRIDDGTEILLVAKKINELKAEIESLTGLNVEQFRQVMVLPQGQFRKLLLADSSEREDIFSKLFQTQIFKQLENKLQEQAKDVIAQRQATLQQISAIEDGLELDEDNNLATTLITVEEGLQQSEDLKIQQRQQLDKYYINKQTIENKNALINSLNNKNQQLIGFISKEVEVVGWRNQLLNAQKVQPLISLHQQFLQQQSRQQQAQLKLDSVQQQQQILISQQQQQQVRLQSAEVKYQQLDGKKATLVRLQPLVDVFAKLAVAQLNVEQLTQQQQQNNSSLAQAELQLQQGQQQQALLQKEIENHKTQLQNLQHVAVKYQQLKQQKNTANHWQTLQQQLKQLHNQQQTQRAQYQSSLGEWQLKKRQFDGLQLSFYQQQAAILAAKLEDNQPCMVCGSTSHPQLAVSESELVSEEQLAIANEQVALLSEQLADIKQKGDATNVTMNSLQDQMAQTLAQLDLPYQISEHNPEAFTLLDDDMQTAEQQVQLAERLGSTLQLAEQQYKQAEIQRQNIQQQVQALQQQQLSLSAQFATANEQWQQLLAIKPSEFATQAELTGYLNDCQQDITRIQSHYEQMQQQNSQLLEQVTIAKQQQLSQTEQLAQLNSDVKHAQQQFSQALAESQFASVEGMQLAELSAEQQNKLQQQIEQFTSQLHQLKGEVAQLQSQVGGQTITPLEAVLEQIRSLEEVLAHTELQVKQHHARVQQLRRAQQQLQAAQQTLLNIDEQYKIVGTLAEVATGKTGLKVSLQRFVLAVLLDDVLIEASLRLQTMSKGRYQLLRKEERAKGNKGSGLELLVEDAYTGRSREVATLSGGESFMAALSLALGLSDVVQAYSGGIRLDTLFIDEGFGSLDPESLELAIRALVDLQATGRMIGIISHVSELKEQIQKRIDVIATREGSEIQIVS